jgi:hypothetical protein
MARAFVRQLGAQPGVQLNPIKDRTEGGGLGVFDQTVAIIGRFTRGRIDKPFRVNRSNFELLLGKTASITLSLLNEAAVQAYEALQRGAREVVVQRLSVPAAAISWLNFASGSTSSFAASPTAPVSGTFGVRHLGCHNDGIVVKVHADEKLVTGSQVGNDMVTVQVTDAQGAELFRFKGSLTAGSVDEFNQSNYLPDVSAATTDLLEWTIISGATIEPSHDGYGKDAGGADKWAASAVTAVFSEGGTGYVTGDYDQAVTALANSQEDFGYIISGGSRAVGLITRLADLAFDTNRQFIFDVPGDLSVAGAIAFMESLSFGGVGRDHYPQAYWAPLRSTDPANGNRVVLGAGGAQAGFRCARNAATNAYGLAAKNQPIAGVNGALGRSGVTQLVSLSQQDLSDLASARINPVIYQTFSTGGGFYFTDAITVANTQLSYRKLVSVAEMSAHLDEAVARFGRECLMLPMEESIQRMSDYLERLFGFALASVWLVQPDDPDTPPFAFEVTRNPASPADGMQVTYRLHYDGVARQVIVQQSIV